MFKKMKERVVLTASIMLFALLTGCDAPEVEIIVAPEYRDAMIQVDFIKVPRSQMTRWLAKDVDDYFSPNDRDRADAVARGEVYSTYYNVPNREFRGVIGSKDPIWNRFQFDEGSSEQSFDILVIADIPGVFSGGPIDIRREVIPLYKKAWRISFIEGLLGGGLDKLEISITQRGILLDPAPQGGNWP